MPYATNALAGRSILVLEDEYFLADYMVSAIASAGGLVQGPFAAGVDALAHVAVAELFPDAATLNVNVSDGPSFDVADELIRLGIPFIFASAYAQTSLPGRFSRTPLLTKPFAAYQVVEALAALVGTSDGLIDRGW